MKRTSRRLSMVVLALCCAPASAALDVGDKAPPLTIGEWIKGNPVKPEEPNQKNVYVIEFWATWCGWCRSSIPHLTSLQAKYKDKGVVVVGVSDEPSSKVRPFVEKLGEKMAYTIACDADQATTRAYMAAAGIDGIPYAFIVGKDGKIAWHAHPMDRLEEVLDAVLAGTFDAQVAKEQRDKVAKLEARFDESYGNGDWEQALASAEELNRLRPDPAVYHVMKFRCQAAMGDTEAARATGEAFLKAVDDPSFLNHAAWDLATNEEYAGRYNDLALAIAKKAYDRTDGKDWNVVDTYARVKFETGDADGALRLQRKAVELAEQEGTPALDELRQALGKYAQAASAGG